MVKAGYGSKLLRQESCGRCIYATMVGDGRHRCRLNGRVGSYKRACSCAAFESRFPPGKITYDEDGIAIRSQTSVDYRTLTQWAQADKLPLPAATGIEMKPVYLARKTKRYYSDDEVAGWQEQGLTQDEWFYYSLIYKAREKQDYVDARHNALHEEEAPSHEFLTKEP